MNDVKRGFKKKTIAKNINDKMEEWLKSIEDKVLVSKIRDSYIVTGGAIASMLLGDLPNDYDVYFNNPLVAKDVVDYYLNQVTTENGRVSISSEIQENAVRVIVKSSGIMTTESNKDYRYFEMLPPEEMDNYINTWALVNSKDYTVALISSNAISLHGGIQIVTRFTGQPDDIHKNYDFVHCTNYYTHNQGVVLNQAALEATLARELKYVGEPRYPICSMFRLKKFIKRGWTITAGECLKIAFDINRLNLDDHNVLMDQLIGVDAAYFHQVLRIIKEKKIDNNMQLDRTYLFEAINRVFDSNEDI